MPRRGDENAPSFRFVYSRSLRKEDRHPRRMASAKPSSMFQTRKSIYMRNEDRWRGAAGSGERVARTYRHFDVCVRDVIPTHQRYACPHITTQCLRSTTAATQRTVASSWALES